MAYDSERNPYIPGDLYSYDLGWMVEEVKKAQAVGVAAEGSAAEAAAQAEAAAASAETAAQSEAAASASAAAASVSEDAAADSAAEAHDTVRNLQSTVDTNTRNIATLDARVDSFASLPAGSTAGNAELLDIRIGANGETYDTAGNAVRGQFGMLPAGSNVAMIATSIELWNKESTRDTIYRALRNLGHPKQLYHENIDSSGNIIANEHYRRTEPILIDEKMIISNEAWRGWDWRVVTFNSEQISSSSYVSTSYYETGLYNFLPYPVAFKAPATGNLRYAVIVIGEEDADFTGFSDEYFLSRLSIFRSFQKDIFNAYPTDSASGSIASFSDGADGVPVKELKVSIAPLQSGSGDPSPTNIRPISGWDSVNVVRTGKNLFSFDKIAGKYIYRATIVKITENSFYLTGARGATDYPILDVNDWAHTRRRIFVAKEATAVTVSCKVQNYTADCNGNISLRYQPADSAITDALTNIQTEYFNDVGEYDITLTGTIPANSWCVIVMTPASKGEVTTLTQETLVTDFQIELGSTATAYEPYAGATTPITLPSTVYGGTLNVTTGELTGTHAKADMGLLDWYTTANGFYANVYGSLANNQSSICSQYAFKPTANAASGSTIISKLSDNEYAWYSNQSRVFIRDDSFNADPAAFKTAMAGQTLVYELATPQTYQLTPTEVSTLLGQNNVWADAGEVEVTIRRDPTLAYDQLKNAIISLGGNI